MENPNVIRKQIENEIYKYEYINEIYIIEIMTKCHQWKIYY